MSRVVAVALALGTAFGLGSCSGSSEAEACPALVQAYEADAVEAAASLDELLAYRAAVSLHDRTHHDLQFEHAKAVVQREVSREALVEAGCEVE